MSLLDDVHRACKRALLLPTGYFMRIVAATTAYMCLECASFVTGTNALHIRKMQCHFFCIVITRY